MGYTVADIIRIYVGNQIPSNNESRYTDDFIEKLDDALDGIITGTISLSHVDKRSYADVVQPSIRLAAPIV